MRTRARVFQAALVSVVITALVFAAGWLYNDHEARAAELQFQRGQLDSYYLPDVLDDRYAADTYLLLLKVVPASILAAWLLGTWLICGREALRPAMIKTYFRFPE